MTTALTALTVLLILQAGTSGRVPAPAPEPPQPAGVPEVAQAATVSGEKAFRVLFIGESERPAQADLALAPAAAAQRAAESRTADRKVVCGMVVIQADPSVDPKIVKQVPGDPAGMKIRRIPAAACTD